MPTIRQYLDQIYRAVEGAGMLNCRNIYDLLTPDLLYGFQNALKALPNGKLMQMSVVLDREALSPPWWWIADVLERKIEDCSNHFWVAKEDIDDGELLLLAAPVHLVKESPSSIALLQGSIAKTLQFAGGDDYRALLCDYFPRDLEELDGFEGRCEAQSQELIALVGQDEADRIATLVTLNAVLVTLNAEFFAYLDVWSKLASAILYPPAASLFNHSCVPNVARVELGPYMMYRAIRKVAKGEPLTISYIGTKIRSESVHIRREVLSRDWHFYCRCEACSEEDKRRASNGYPTVVFGQKLRSFLRTFPEHEQLALHLQILEETQKLPVTVKPAFENMINLYASIAVLAARLHKYDLADEHFGNLLNLHESRFKEEDEIWLHFALIRSFTLLCVKEADAAKTLLRRVVRRHHLLQGAGPETLLVRFGRELQWLFGNGPIAEASRRRLQKIVRQLS